MALVSFSFKANHSLSCRQKNESIRASITGEITRRFKKKPSFIQINSMFITKLSLGHSIDEKNLAKRVILKDLIVLLDKESQDL